MATKKIATSRPTDSRPTANNRFWAFANETSESVDLYINGEIVDDFTGEIAREIYGDELADTGYTAPKGFKEKLAETDGKNISVYIDSYGGDVFAASTIYNLLKEHKGGVTVKITGVAASAASVIAMAGDKVLMSETAVIMIHNPSTWAEGDHNDMQKAIDVLDTIKDSIINAYKMKTGLSRNKISELMENETWMDYREAKKLGFCDGPIAEREGLIPDSVIENCLRRNMLVYNALSRDKVEKTPEVTAEPEIEPVAVTYNTEVDEQLYEYYRLAGKK